VTSMSTRRILTLLAAGLFGLLAWLSATMAERYQVTLTAPLIVEQVPPGFAVSTPVPRTVQLHYKGDGWRLAFLQLGTNPSLVLGFNSLRLARTSSSRADTSPVPARIITRLDIAERAPVRAGVELTDVTPDSIFIALDHYEERSVPLRLDITTSFRDGYGQVGGAAIVPDSVTIGGAATIVRTISSWPTVRHDFRDLRAPVEADVPLVQSPLLQLVLSTATTHVSLNIEPFAEKVMGAIAVDGRNVPQNREVIFIPPKVDVIARGGIKQLATLTPADFQVHVDYGNIVTDTTGFIDPVISGPSGIQIVTKRPDRLQYIVRKRLRGPYETLH
jgi:hypothetical protein